MAFPTGLAVLASRLFFLRVPGSAANCSATSKMAVVTIPPTALQTPHREQNPRLLRPARSRRHPLLSRNPGSSHRRRPSFFSASSRPTAHCTRTSPTSPNIDQASAASIPKPPIAAAVAAPAAHHAADTPSRVVQFLTRFLAPYSALEARLRELPPAGRTEGRDLPLRRRNDLLHTDAFPTRPTYGARILRFFNNINPTRTRDWIVSDPFRRDGSSICSQRNSPRPGSALSRVGKVTGRAIGLGAAIPSIKRSPYDDFMMRFHNFLKENPRFQASCPKYPFQFPPGSCWMVYTDTVPHAVLAGQYALEQTFLVRPEAMVTPETSPLAVLQEIAGSTLL